MTRRIALVVIFALLVTALAACGGGGGGGTTDGGTDGTMPTLDGATLLESRCTTCHNLDRVDQKELDFAGWVALIQKMIDKGAQLTPEEKTVLADYLANL